MSKISVVIPCYNQAEYLDESVGSVLAQTFQDFEIIIIDDGSDDEESIRILDNFKKPKTRIIRIPNSGPSIARNTGIKAAEGEYILPLDADDRIGPKYLEKSFEILDNNDKIGIVYCKAEFFGEKSGEWDLPEYKFPDILLANTIFCSALFRKSDWQEVNGYNSEMEFSIEDWEFWLSIIEKGLEVYRIPETLFYYRIKNSSRTKESKYDHELAMRKKLLEFHRNLYEENLEFILEYYYEQNVRYCLLQNRHYRFKSTYHKKIKELEAINAIRFNQAEEIKQIKLKYAEEIKQIKLKYTDEINKLKSSKSWKLTGPLRNLGSFMRSFKRKSN
jgi:glycosyltransferase involved in cell wall biosynthesis